MMKNLFLLTALALCCSVPVKAEKPLRVGLKIGANLTSPSNVDFSDWSSDGQIRSSVGFTGGAFVKFNIPLSSLFVEAEALYSYYRLRIDPDQGNEDFRVGSHKVEIPLHVGIRMLKLLELYAGPSFNYLSSGNIDADGVILDEARSQMKIAGDLGARLAFERYSLDLRYQFPLSSSRSYIENAGDIISFKTNPSMFTLSFGYSFL